MTAPAVSGTIEQVKCLYSDRQQKLAESEQRKRKDINDDYDYYYDYYNFNGLGYPQLEQEDRESAASINAYYQVMSSNDYSQEQLTSWASSRGYKLLETNKCGLFKKPTDESSKGRIKQEVKEELMEEFSSEYQVSPTTQKIKTEKEEQKADGMNSYMEEESELSPINVITTNSTSSSLSTDFFTCFEVKSSRVNGLRGRESPPPAPPPPRPRMTFLEATEPVKLPNGVTLPPGTKQIIVHPYHRPIY